MSDNVNENTNDIAEAHDEDVEECLKRSTDDGSGLENDDESLLPEAELDKSVEDEA